MFLVPILQEMHGDGNRNTCVVRSLVERLQLMPWHGFELHAECFEFGAAR
jgi:hypothetical protein